MSVLVRGWVFDLFRDCSFTAALLQLENRLRLSSTGSVKNVFAPHKQLILSGLVPFLNCRFLSFLSPPK